MASPPRTLLRQQLLFSELVAKLLTRIASEGYGVTLDECYRPPETCAVYAKQGRGSKNSLHMQRLAIDLNLFLGVTYCEEGADYRPFGMWWKRQHPDCRWGGDFVSRDYRHFSLTWQGRA